MADVRYLLWDFGDTLVDQRWMWPSPDGAPGWTEWFQALGSNEVAARWELGELTSEDLAALFAAESGMTIDAVMAHMESTCRNIQFFEHAWAAARTRSLAQAIVTLNPDVFTRFVVPAYELDSVFDVIVTSWEEHTRDKSELCQIALERLGGHDSAESLLIDNIEENVEAWRARGGRTYLFVGDDDFERSGWSRRPL